MAVIEDNSAVPPIVPDEEESEKIECIMVLTDQPALGVAAVIKQLKDALAEEHNHEFATALAALETAQAALSPSELPRLLSSGYSAEV